VSLQRVYKRVRTVRGRRVSAPIRVSGGRGSYFHVGDLIRVDDGKLMEVTARTTAHYVWVVRASWWRPAWLNVRRAARYVRRRLVISAPSAR
jgi:hypothetical protein